MRKFILLALMFLATSLCYGGSSRTFDGTNDEISGGNVLDVTVGNMSLCSYVMTTEDASSDYIAGRKDTILTTAVGYALYQAAATDFVTFMVTDGTDSVISIATTDTDGAWHMVCGTWDSATETTAVFVDGTQEDTDVGGGAVGSLTNAETFKSGEDDNDTNDANGDIAYVMQFSRVLTAAEIQEIRWHPDYIVGSIGVLWPFWGDSPETNIGTQAFTGVVIGAAALDVSGPAIMIGDAPV